MFLTINQCIIKTECISYSITHPKIVYKVTTSVKTV